MRLALTATAGRREGGITGAIGINAHNEVLKWKHPFHAYFKYKSIHLFLQMMPKYQSYDLESFLGDKLEGWYDKVEILLHINQIICQNNHQNTVFVSDALHDEIINRNNQIFEKMRGGVHILQTGSTVQ